MKIHKKISLCFICLCFVFALSGCAKVQYQRLISSDGKIIDAVSVKLDQQKIEASGFDIETVKNDVKIKMNIYINAIFNAFQNRDDKLLEIEKIAVKNNVLAEVNETENCITASLTFKNYSAFKYFYGLHLIEEDADSDSTKTTEQFLYNKTSNTGKTIFSGEDAKFVTDEFVAYFENKFSLDDVELSYVFATPEGKVHSNATYNYEIDGIHYHEWIVEDINQEITTFTVQVKPVNWYIVALLCTVGLIIILFVIAIINRKKHLKNLQPEIDTNKQIVNQNLENQTNYNILDNDKL